MKKKTIIIISLLSAVFSLIYILLNYFGLVRYIGMYIYPIEGFINKYKNIDQINIKNKVIISLIATTPQLENINPVIKSLLDQTVRVDLISIILPSHNTWVLPTELTKTVAIFKCPPGEKTQTGNLDCLLSTITREGESTTKIITLGAGVIYGKDFIEILLETSEKNPNSIIYVNSDSKSESYIDLEKGSLYSMNFFDQDFLNIGPPADMHANEWINKYFKNRDKKKIVYNENYKQI